MEHTGKFRVNLEDRTLLGISLGKTSNPVNVFLSLEENPPEFLHLRETTASLTFCSETVHNDGIALLTKVDVLQKAESVGYKDLEREWS